MAIETWVAAAKAPHYAWTIEDGTFLIPAQQERDGKHPKTLTNLTKGLAAGSASFRAYATERGGVVGDIQLLPVLKPDGTLSTAAQTADGIYRIDATGLDVWLLGVAGGTAALKIIPTL